LILENVPSSRPAAAMLEWMRWLDMLDANEELYRCSTMNASNDALKTCSSSVLVGAYYYPWYYNDFHHCEKSSHLRAQLSPKQEPVLGQYNDRDTSTIRQHLQWCLQYNIHLWVTSWWGPGKREDVTTSAIFEYLESCQPAHFQLAIFYESKGRIKERPKKSGNYDTSSVKQDLHYIAETYFGRPNYLRIDGKPVLFIYLTRTLAKQGILQYVVALMREGAQQAGYNDVYIVGDHAFGKAPKDQCVPALDVLQAVTNYDVFGSMKRPFYAGNESVNAFRQQQEEWKDVANNQGCGFIPSVTPGFNNLVNKNLIEISYGPMSRRLTEKDKEGSLFGALLQNAMTLVDPNVNILMITSFNEYHEDSQIEPVKLAIDDEHDGSVCNTTREPKRFTRGLEYEAYGTTYLELVKQYTT
jgi:hypothetical protein